MMSKIYIINVGANTAHSAQARSPIFEDGTWVYVPFPNGNQGQHYVDEAQPFVRVEPQTRCHLDPDWDRLTYGDMCGNPRARALMRVVPGDILLFWALLWRADERDQNVWRATKRGWYLIGALRVDHILEYGQPLPPAYWERAGRNAHVVEGRVEARKGVRVFIGDETRSARFHRAVDLGVGRDDGLLRQTVRAKDGRLLEWDRKPRWNSVTRACRAIINMESLVDQIAAERLARHISALNPGYDLLGALETSSPAKLVA